MSGMLERTMIFLVVASSLMGCSTNPNKIIEQQEDEAKRSHIVFKVQNPDYQILLDKNNKITQICNVASSTQCNSPMGIPYGIFRKCTGLMFRTETCM